MHKDVDGGDMRVRNVAISSFLIVFARKMLPIASAGEFSGDLIVFSLQNPNFSPSS